MATEVKPDGRNAQNALKDATRSSNIAALKMGTALREVSYMREGTGRPNLDRINSMLLEISNYIGESRLSLSELRVIWAQAGLTVDVTTGDDLKERVEAIEQQLAHLYEQMGVRLQ
jgi:hypothetical protein